jgi:hypothetical protein
VHHLALQFVPFDKVKRAVLILSSLKSLFEMPRILGRNELLSSKRLRLVIKPVGSPSSHSSLGGRSKLDESRSNLLNPYPSKSGLSYRICERRLEEEREDGNSADYFDGSSDSMRRNDHDWGHFVDFNSPATYDRKFLNDFTGRSGRNDLATVQEAFE